MKRHCNLCLEYYQYTKVKKYPHKLQLCAKCRDVIADLSLTPESFIRH
jgi:hypothetical protein